jgi:hypothetical protein
MINAVSAFQVRLEVGDKEARPNIVGVPTRRAKSIDAANAIRPESRLAPVQSISRTFATSDYAIGLLVSAGCTAYII